MQNNQSNEIAKEIDGLIFDLYDLTKEGRDAIGFIEIQ